jgi:mannose-6-phosphate isomerase-like protein (cupin superfamily)
VNTADFETALRRAGYQDVEHKQTQPDFTTQPHSHPFDVRALVLEGEMTLTSQGESRTYRAGEIFEMAAGCEHSECFGPAGAKTLAGRRRPAS